MINWGYKFMQIEYEATFADIDKEEMRKKLQEIGAVLVRPEFLQRRVTFNFPTGHENPNGWLRVRDEKDKITMTIKIVDGGKIENQKEITLNVDSFDEAIEFLSTVGCQKKSYQETKRELWKLDDVEIMIDEWPFLEPYVEVEGKSEKAVRIVSEKIGFDYKDAFFGCVSPLYAKKYNITEELINNHIPEITFQGKNPFL